MVSGRGSLPSSSLGPEQLMSSVDPAVKLGALFGYDPVAMGRLRQGDRVHDAFHGAFDRLQGVALMAQTVEDSRFFSALLPAEDFHPDLHLRKSQTLH